MIGVVKVIRSTNIGKPSDSGPLCELLCKWGGESLGAKYD
jgi:hypothetical protein